MSAISGFMAQSGVSRMEEKDQQQSVVASVEVHCIQVHFVLARTCVLAPSVLKNLKSKQDDAVLAPILVAL